MNRQQAKKLLPIIQAYAEGKTIQYYYKCPTPHWGDVPPNRTASFNEDASNYRIKPEPTYRPFKDAKECLEEMQKHQPFGLIKSNVDKNFYSILAITSHGCVLIDENIISFEHFYKYNTFADGTPFGIEKKY